MRRKKSFWSRRTQQKKLLKALQNNRGLQKQTTDGLNWGAGGTLRKLAEEEIHCLKTQKKLLKSILRHEPQTKKPGFYKMAYDTRKEERTTSFYHCEFSSAAQGPWVTALSPRRKTTTKFNKLRKANDQTEKHWLTPSSRSSLFHVAHRGLGDPGYLY